MITSNIVMDMEKLLTMSMKDAVNRSLDEVIEKAKEELEEQLRKSVDSVVLNASSHYSVMTNEKEIVIRVKREG